MIQIAVNPYWKKIAKNQLTRRNEAVMQDFPAPVSLFYFTFAQPVRILIGYGKQAHPIQYFIAKKGGF